MAIKLCVECEKPVSTEAAACPHCGHPISRRARKGKSAGAGKLIAYGCAIVLLLFIGLGVLGTCIESVKRGSQIATKQTPVNRSFAMGQTVTLGYTSYCLWSARWAKQLPGDVFDRRPNASFLILDVSVRNDDKKARTIPPFHLLDDQGREHQEDSAGAFLDNSLGLIESLNPGVTKQGLILFDVLASDTYKLKVSGGYWSSDEALIDIVAR